MIARGLWAFIAMVVLLQQVATGRVFCHHSDGSWHLETIGAPCCDSKAGFTSTAEAGEKTATANDPYPDSHVPGCDDCADFALETVQMTALVGISMETSGAREWPVLDLMRSSAHPRTLAWNVNPSVHRDLARSTRMVLRC